MSTTIRQVGRASAQNPGGFTGRVAVTPDVATGSLVVWANETDFNVLADVIAGIARPALSASVAVKIYPLNNIDSFNARRAVQDFISPAPSGRQARRVRGLEVTLLDASGEVVSGVIDPASVSVTSDPTGTSLIVSAPREAFPLLDRFVGLIDQSIVGDRLSIRRYPLVSAGARDLAGIVQRLLETQRQGPGSWNIPRPRVEADQRTNALLITGTDAQHDEATRIIAEADIGNDDSGIETATLSLEHVRASGAQRVVEQILIGRDASKRDRIQLSAQDDSGTLIVRADADTIAEVRSLVAELDLPGSGTFPVRSIKLDRADAAGVARELQRFFQQRARVAGQRGARGRGDAAIIGDRESGTLVIAASDEDYEQIASLAAQFDAPAADRGADFRVVQLENSRASEVVQTLQSIAQELQYERMWGNNNRDASSAGRVLVEANERTNTVVLFGAGDALDTMESVAAKLDSTSIGAPGETIVKAIRVENADLRSLERLIEQITADPTRPWWQDGRDTEQVLVEVDQTRRLLLLIGVRARVEEAARYVEQIAAASTGEGQVIETIPLRHAQADRAARSLQQFFRGRARSERTREDAVAVIGSREGNLLIVSASPEDLVVLRDLVAQLDRPELGDDRAIEVYRLANTEPAEAAETVRRMFPAGGPVEDRVIVLPQPSTSARIVSAPEAEHARVAALLTELDSVRIDDAASIMRVPLESARADDVARLLRSALPDTLRVTITSDARSNTLLVTGSDEAIELVRAQVADLDRDVERQPVVFRRFELIHADDIDLAFTLRQLLRTRPRDSGEPTPNVDYSGTANALSVTAGPDEMAFIEQMIAELDVPEEGDRRTEFINLEFADAAQAAEALSLFFGRTAPEARTAAEREVSIYADSASKSLVISGPEAVFDRVRTLLTTLDTEEYDTSKQLIVIPLRHADARAVARALNDGFRAPLEQELRREDAQRDRGRARGGRDGRGDSGSDRTVLVNADETPAVAAEQESNSLIVFASRREIQRIRDVVEQLDTPDFQRLPEPRLVRLSDVSAARLRPTLLAAFQPIAERRGEALVVEADRALNALIVSTSADIHARVDAFIRLVDENATFAGSGLDTDISAASVREDPEQPAAVDALMGDPAGGAAGRDAVRFVDDQGMKADGIDADSDPMIVELHNVSPQEMVRLLTELGVTRPPRDDRPSLVNEPVTLTPLRTRRAVAVLAGVADRRTVASIIARLDAEPLEIGQQAEIFPLRLADASALVPLLGGMLTPSSEDGKTDPAAAVAEQIRRLQINRGETGEILRLDVSEPIRILADTQSNAVVVASTPQNIEAIGELINMLDALPLGDAVIVRIMPLENASALRLRQVIDELFRRGATLASPGGAGRETQATTTTGQALAGEVAVSIDERTNALVVAGREEAVALVEVLVAELDAEDGERGWLETEIVQLRFADPVILSRKLREVLIDGIGRTPDAIGIQRQIGRLRLAIAGSDAVESDLFAPLSGLVIVPEENLRAVIVVGTSANVSAVRELIDQLDIEQASAANSVRVIPLLHADAGRVASVASDIFDGRDTLESTRAEDRLIVSVDERTNALIVSTSARSFEILDGLLRTLDREESRFAVGLHVIPVPGADVRQLAPKIQRLMQDRLRATQRRGGVESPLDVFSIEAVEGSDLLIAACSDENLVLVNELITALAGGSDEIARSDAFDLPQVVVRASRNGTVRSVTATC
ncbi:MAG: secretin N-terminal domain-containing protein [Planctomycetota bacterium]